MSKDYFVGQKNPLHAGTSHDPHGSIVEQADGLGPHPALDLLHGNASGIAKLPAATQALLVSTVEHSFHVLFLVALGISLLSVVAAFYLKDLPLRTTAATMPVPVRPAEPPEIFR